MNQRTKKIIAREVLYFFYIHALLMLIWGVIELRSYYFSCKIESMYANTVIVKSELKERLMNFVNVANEGSYQTEKDLMNQFPELKVYGVEVLKDFVATYNAQKYKTENELLIKFPEFFNDDNEQKFKENIKDISDNEHALQSNNGLIGKLEILAFILYLILYPIRLIFYLIIWSFKTLNDHD